MAGVTAALPSGYQLGRYAIEAPISQGAMGAVYRATNRVNGEPVAVKRLLDTRHAARFEIEARLLSQLKHPRVVEVIDHFQDQEGVYYLVMELVQGVDLGETLKQEGNPGLPVAQAIEYTRQACEALQYVHDQRIVHRDVKPANLIRSSEEGVVLVDFGVAARDRRDRRGHGRRSARRASWRPRCSRAARCRSARTCSRWRRRCGR